MSRPSVPASTTRCTCRPVWPTPLPARSPPRNAPPRACGERDPSVWSARPGPAAGNRQVARLDELADADGRLHRSPADLRRQHQAQRLHRRRAARHGRIEPRAGSPARGDRRRAGLAAAAHARFDRPGRRARRDRRARSHAVSAREQVGHDHRTEFAGRAFPPAPAGRGRAALGGSLRRHHRPRHRARTTRARGAFPRRVHQPVRHRRPLLGALVLRHGAGGADGTGRVGDHRLVAGHARRLGTGRDGRRGEPLRRARTGDGRRRRAMAATS